MDGIAERIEDRADFIGDVVGQGDHVEGGQAQIFCESALHIDADAACARIEVELAARDWRLSAPIRWPSPEQRWPIWSP